VVSHDQAFLDAIKATATYPIHPQRAPDHGRCDVLLSGPTAQGSRPTWQFKALYSKEHSGQQVNTLIEW
jgi:hypothetical protein